MAAVSWLAAVLLLLVALGTGASRPTEGQGLFAPTAPADSRIKKAKEQFLKKYGKGYGYGGRIDEIYAKEIAPRLGPGEHYLDYTAAGLPWNSQIAAIAAELQRHVFGNPHSASPSSLRTDAIVEQTRSDLLRFFGASEEDYTLIFTRSGTTALQLMGEAFPFSPASRFAYLYSNHNSVLGIREYAKERGAAFGSLSEEEVEAWLAGEGPGPGPVEPLPGSNQDQPAYSLFAYPAYDNYAGVIYPKSWVRQVQALSTDQHKWKVLLDAAAFVPTHKLNLTETPADFLGLSFYKIFGYPTGAGALILRKENTEILKKIYWGGGSVFLATAGLDWKVWNPMPHAFEHGTLPFLDIIGIQHGLRVIETVGGISAVEDHVAAVGEYLYDALSALRHSDGRPIVHVVAGKHHLPNRREVQGSTVNFELLASDGEVLGYKEAAVRFGAAGLHIRTGCTCNPGACYNATGVRDAEVRELALQKHGDFEDWEWIWVHREKLSHLPLGSIRVSLGLTSRFEDAYALVEYIKEHYRDAPAPKGETSLAAHGDEEGGGAAELAGRRRGPPPFLAHDWGC